MDSYTDPILEKSISFSTPASRVEAEAHIQAKIKHHHDESIICYYKRCHNALNFSCRFPLDILVLIFAEVIKLSLADYCELQWEPFGEKSWVKSISHVCSHWRNVALATPALWTDIPIGSGHTEWITEMLRRSMSTPLTIKYEDGVFCAMPETYNAIKEFLEQHSSRIGRISLVDPSESGVNHREIEEQKLIGLVTPLRHAPLLKHLDLHSPALTDYTGQTTLVISSPLTHLSLQGYRLSWDLPACNFKNLRYLCISDLPQNMRASMTQLWSVLSQAPLLKTLKVVRALEDVGHSLSTPPQTLVPVNLEFLEEIELHCYFPTASLFFDYLIFPKTIGFINFTPSISGDDPEQFVPYMKDLGHKLNNAVDGAISQLQLHKIAACWKSCNCNRSESWICEESPTIQIDFRHSYLQFITVAPLAHAFLQSLSLDGLTSLDVNKYVSLPKKSWAFLGGLANIECVRLTHNNIVFFFETFHWTIVENYKAARCPTFVSLRRLSVIESDLDYPLRPHKSLSTARTMYLAFKFRAKEGLQLEELKIERCTGVTVQNRDSFNQYVNSFISGRRSSSS
ncbi:hypothetical protein H0H92_005502 [Tricholoma furcatifolium]|nr:hypothetical protein H0H92_005502 [Tricholoma furcatifolium]